MNDPRPDRLSASLKHLGDSRASEGFTERVLEGLDRRLEQRSRRRSAGVAAAAAALLVVVALAVLRPGAAPEPTADETAVARAHAEDIRREHRRLLDELDRLRRSQEQTTNVLYLGSGDEYDLVLDLDPLLDRMSDAQALPASTSRRQP
jgi:hypothetical protein